MPELKFCGCLLMKEQIQLSKETKDKNGKYEIVCMFHDYYHLVDKTGDNTKKVELFNKGEQLRLNMAKRTFNILVDEKVYDDDDDELGNKMFVNGEKFSEMMKIYMKYHGLTDQKEINQEEFDKWVDVISRKYLNEKFGTTPDEEYDEMIEVVKKYCDEKGCEPHEIDYDVFFEWVKKSEMPISENVKKLFSKST